MKVQVPRHGKMHALITLDELGHFVCLLVSEPAPGDDEDANDANKRGNVLNQGSVEFLGWCFCNVQQEKVPRAALLLVLQLALLPTFWRTAEGFRLAGCP